MATMNGVCSVLEKALPERDKDPAVLRKLAKARLAVQLDGNFTLVALVLPHGKVAMGAAKRNPGADREDVERGLRIALTRAYRRFRKMRWK